MNELMIFSNVEFGKIRVVQVEGEPWFVGKDVAVSLGYERPTDTVRKHVDNEDRGVAKIETPSGAQEMTIINESGLYSLILSSKLPGAKKFKRWVTSEVLPSIRKTGGYSMDEITESQKAFLSVQEKTAHIQAATLLNQIAGDYTGTYRQILQAYAAKELIGEFALPLPEMPEETYTAEQIGNRLGIKEVYYF